MTARRIPTRPSSTRRSPTVLGQLLKSEDNLNIWYLHVWAWTPNADGVFADFSSAVVCPTTARKVFTPFRAP